MDHPLFGAQVDSDSELLPLEVFSAIPLSLPGPPITVPHVDRPAFLVFRRCNCGCFPSSVVSGPLGMLPNSVGDDKRQWPFDRLKQAVNDAGFQELAG